MGRALKSTVLALCAALFLNAAFAQTSVRPLDGEGGGGGGGSEQPQNPIEKGKDKVEEALCTGELFNPTSDPDWNNIYPITIAGVRTTSKARQDPPLMRMPSVCVCPSYFFNMPMVGIGITYWQPVYVVETEFRPGCSPSMGGTVILKGYSTKRSEEADEASETSQTNLKHTHLYEYPLFKALSWLSDIWCHSPKGFNLVFMSEIDSTWDDDEFSAYIAPEATLFANPVAQAACIVDAIAANVFYPLDPLFWCAGSWGGIYPLSGNSGQANGPLQNNNLIMAKLIARQARLGRMWQTIGPTAQCYSHPNPIIIKSQYRINQVGPVVRKGYMQTIGDLGLDQWPAVANFPAKGEHTVNLLWQGMQCCMKIIP